MFIILKRRSLCDLSRTAFCLLLAGSLAAFGCASKYGTQKISATYYPDCYAPINELRSSEFAVGKSVAGGAVAGAALGALIGYLATGKASGAIVGGAAGAVAGGTAGGVYGQYSQDKDDQVRLAQYNTQLDGGIREVDKATAAARVARQCYERQFAVAASEYKAKRLTREQFTARYTEVLGGMEEAAEILGEANKNSAQVVAGYNATVNQEEQRIVRAVSSGESSIATAQRNAMQVSQVRARTNTMQKSVSAGQAEEKLMRERLSAMERQARDLMS